MKIQIQMVIKSDNGQSQSFENIAQFSRNELSLQTLGMTLVESKNILETIQGIMIAEQVEAWIQKERQCNSCLKLRAIKGWHKLVARTAFGKLTLESPRWYNCQCQSDAGKSSYSPLAELFLERTTPELLYLETKYASLMSYGLSVDILSEFLPIGNHLNQTTLRRQQQ